MAGGARDPRAAMRRRVIAEWRRHWVPRDTSAFERTTGELVPAVLKSLGVEERVAEERLGRAWAGVVGPFIASHSRPVKLERGGVLLVAVSQPAVMYTLERDLKAKVLAKLKAAVGDVGVRRLRFVHG